MQIRTRRDTIEEMEAKRKFISMECYRERSTWNISYIFPCIVRIVWIFVPLKLHA